MALCGRHFVSGESQLTASEMIVAYSYVYLAMFLSGPLYTAYTVWRRYNAVNFLTNIHKRHPMARPLAGPMGCLLLVQHLVDILLQSM